MEWSVAGAGITERVRIRRGVVIITDVDRRVAMLLVVLLVACTGDSGSGNPSTDLTRSGEPAQTASASQVAAATFDCTDPIDMSSTLPPGFDDLGGVALQTSSTYPLALQTSSSGRADPSQRLFAKAALLVRANVTAEIVVPSAFVGRVAFEWGNTVKRTLTTHLRVGPCTGRDWMAFPGGYYVQDPMCVYLAVIVAGIDPFRVSVGVGTPCAGQQPPPQPSAT